MAVDDVQLTDLEPGQRDPGVPGVIPARAAVVRGLPGDRAREA